jgi:hypothetical protein
MPMQLLVIARNEIRPEHLAMRSESRLYRVPVKRGKEKAESRLDRTKSSLPLYLLIAIAIAAATM